MPTRRTRLSATLNGVALSNILSASCTYSWKSNGGTPMATVYVRSTSTPGPQLYDQTLTLTMGAGNNIVRFTQGPLRGYSNALWPRGEGLVFQGRLIRAAEYQNHDDPLHLGGLTLNDLLGTPTGTDQVIVRAALTRAGVAFTAGNINGTGLTFGTRLGLAPVVWRAGTSANPLIPMSGAGQTALSFIQQWDAVSAVYTSPTAPVGFYRLYETVNGIRRALIGGRPRTAPDLTFNEGIDIEERSKSGRDYPIANAAFVTGADTGLPIGTYKNVDAGGAFLGQSNNFFQPSTRPVTKDYGSPYIEWNNEAEGGVGMNAERVGNALLLDWNRETVTAHLRTPRDELILPGMTIQVRGPPTTGLPFGALWIGQNLWVDTVTTGVTEDGEFYQDIDATGGGLPDPATPAPP